MNWKSYTVLAGIFIAGTITIVAVFSTAKPTEQSLYFSTTQHWKPELRTLVVAQSWATDFAPTLPLPPTQGSETVAAELTYLHSLVASRTPSKITEIESERDIQTGWLAAILTPASSFPHTAFLLSEVDQSLDIIIMRAKHSFDRVRPSYLDPTLSTAISVPLHPSYPSGHATQVFVYAHILSELDPQNTDIYWQRAEEIAVNREYAGVHYPSDTAAGKQLAAAYYAHLLQNSYFQALLFNAQKEWLTF